MSRTKSKRAILAAIPVFIFLIISSSTVSNRSVDAYSRSISEMPNGVVRGGFCCDGECLACNIFLGITRTNCKTLPQTFSASITAELEPSPPYSFNVMGPDGEPVPFFQLAPRTIRFEVTKVGPYTVRVTNKNGCTFICQSGVFPCFSLSQKEWGNPEASYNGRSVQEVIKTLFNTPFQYIHVGIPGQRSVRFPMAGACVIQRLPATGTIKILPEGLGNVAIDPVTCQTTPELPIEEGKFTNPLLGQQIALSVNAFADSRGPVSKFEDIRLCRTIKVFRDSNSDFYIIRIPNSVVNALGPFASVQGLMMLADRALAGNTNLGGATLQDIHDALDAINRGFEGGGLVADCINP